MRCIALSEFFDTQSDVAKEQGILFSLHMKATMMKVSNLVLLGHCVKAHSMTWTLKSSHQRRQQESHVSVPVVVWTS